MPTKRHISLPTQPGRMKKHTARTHEKATYFFVGEAGGAHEAHAHEKTYFFVSAAETYRRDHRAAAYLSHPSSVKCNVVPQGRFLRSD